MERPRILVTRRLPSEVHDRLRRDYDAILNDDDRIYSREELKELAVGVDALLPTVTDRLDADLITSLPESVRIIATFSVGTDHIDLAVAEARGIVVTNTPDVLTNATADIAMLLLLGAARGAARGDAMIRADAWSGWGPTWDLGIDVSGKALGIIGMGRIGQAVAQRARGFDMEIHYHNRGQLAPEAEQGAVFHADPCDMLGRVDFLSLNCASTEKTRGFLNTGRIACMKDGAIVVNTARGDLVDDDALIDALSSGKLAGAGLDVFNNEPKLDPRYRDLPNTFLLPHLGSATVETRNAMGFRALDNLDAFFRGDPPPDRVV